MVCFLYDVTIANLFAQLYYSNFRRFFKSSLGHFNKFYTANVQGCSESGNI
jgi:hypothetical protein